MTARGLLPAALLLVSTAAVGGAAGAFFARQAPAAAPLLAAFFGALWTMALLPGLLAGVGDARAEAAIPDAAPAGSRETLAPALALLMAPFLGLALALPIAGFPQAAAVRDALGAALVATAFAALAAGAGRLAARLLAAPAARPGAAAALATLVAAALLASPLWTGCLLEDADDLGKLMATWAAPLAMLGSALPDLNFSCLPGLYHVWMGSLCPVPHGAVVAALSYVLPAAALWALAALCHRPATGLAANRAVA